MSASRSKTTSRMMFRGLFLAGMLVSLLVLIPDTAFARGQGNRAGRGAGNGWNQNCGNRGARHGYGQGQGRGLMLRERYYWDETSAAQGVPYGQSGSCPLRNARMLSNQN